jgi:hypothetical protein
LRSFRRAGSAKKHDKIYVLQEKKTAKRDRVQETVKDTKNIVSKVFVLRVIRFQIYYFYLWISLEFEKIEVFLWNLKFFYRFFAFNRVRGSFCLFSTVKMNFFTHGAFQ